MQRRSLPLLFSRSFSRTFKNEHRVTYDQQKLFIRSIPNHLELAESLIPTGVDLTDTNPNDSALFLASQFGFSAFIEKLCAHGADVNFGHRMRATAILQPYHNDSAIALRLSRLLSANGLNKQEFNHFTALHVATLYQQYNAVKTLLKHKANPTCEAGGITPINLAIALGNQTILTQLAKQTNHDKYASIVTAKNFKL